jgi:hypothetical protein
LSSIQEQIVRQLSEASFGSAFVFKPDLYKKGRQGNREPVDLVWACSNCILLMAMTKTGGSRDKMFRHNMSQLNGWMRIWKQGRHLVGRNSTQEFNITFDDYRDEVAREGDAYQRLTTQIEVLRWTQHTDGMFPW